MILEYDVYDDDYVVSFGESSTKRTFEYSDCGGLHIRGYRIQFRTKFYRRWR